MEQNEKHSLHLEERSELVMTGVFEVLSFDDGYIEMLLESGSAIVEGSDLRITEFDSEHHRLSAKGNVNAVAYYDGAKKKASRFFSRRRGE